MDLEKQNLVCVGVVTCPHGVRGHVAVKSFTQDPSGIKAYFPLLNEEGNMLPFKFSKMVQDKVILSTEGTSSRDVAEGYRRQKLYVSKDKFPDVLEEEYYHVDLLGCLVKDQDNQPLGEVVGVYNYGAGDILEFSNHQQQLYMVPFHEEAVPLLNLDEKTIVVDSHFICGSK